MSSVKRFVLSKIAPNTLATAERLYAENPILLNDMEVLRENQARLQSLLNESSSKFKKAKEGWEYQVAENSARNQSKLKQVLEESGERIAQAEEKAKASAEAEAKAVTRLENALKEFNDRIAIIESQASASATAEAQATARLQEVINESDNRINEAEEKARVSTEAEAQAMAKLQEVIRDSEERTTQAEEKARVSAEAEALAEARLKEVVSENTKKVIAEEQKVTAAVSQADISEAAEILAKARIIELESQLSTVSDSLSETTIDRANLQSKIDLLMVEKKSLDQKISTLLQINDGMSRIYQHLRHRLGDPMDDGVSWFEAAERLATARLGQIELTHSSVLRTLIGALDSQDLSLFEACIVMMGGASELPVPILNMIVEQDNVDFLRLAHDSGLDLHAYERILTDMAAKAGSMQIVSYLHNQGIRIHLSNAAHLQRTASITDSRDMKKNDPHS